MAARSVSPTGQWPAALRRRHSPPARPARPAARSRSACRAPADEHPPGCAGHQRLVIPEGFDQLCLGHRGAALDADFPGPLEEIRLGPVVVEPLLPALRPTRLREVVAAAFAIRAAFSLLSPWPRSSR